MYNIHIILTGGTIQKTYDPLTEKPEFRSQSILPDYLNDVIKAYPYLTYETVSQIDSVKMDDDVRTDIAKVIAQTSIKRIIIVHGTSTMADTARFLQQNLDVSDKIVILTGAMIPLKEFAMSDGGFNLGYAIAQAQTAEDGIYLAMNARLFTADEVAKNTDTGRFEEQ